MIPLSLARILQISNREDVGCLCLESQPGKDVGMFGCIVAFLIIALAAGLLGLTGIAGVGVGIAKVVFAMFTALFFTSLILRLATK